jgi:hypothetical protein
MDNGSFRNRVHFPFIQPLKMSAQNNTQDAPNNRVGDEGVYRASCTVRIYCDIGSLANQTSIDTIVFAPQTNATIGEVIAKRFSFPQSRCCITISGCYVSFCDNAIDIISCSIRKAAPVIVQLRSESVADQPIVVTFNC